MALLNYPVIMSLDGYVADVDGSFDWATPDEEVHGFVNDLVRGVGTYLYGRHMYEVMTVWETTPALAEHSPVTQDFARIWGAADKVVYSTTLREPMTRRTQIASTFDADSVRRRKSSSALDLAIGGPTLAGHALRAGVVDEVHTVVAPATVGGGLPAFPPDLRLRLRLLSQRVFASSGFVFARYAVER